MRVSHFALPPSARRVYQPGGPSGTGAASLPRPRPEGPASTTTPIMVAPPAGAPAAASTPSARVILGGCPGPLPDD